MTTALPDQDIYPALDSPPLPRLFILPNPMIIFLDGYIQYPIGILDLPPNFWARPQAYAQPGVPQPQTPSSDAPYSSFSALSVYPDRNQLDIDQIGHDPRTTVMLKNIPSRMTANQLIRFIHTVCPRQVDFVYLVIDFSNGHNLGYAFVNFITVPSLLRFARAKLHQKWPMSNTRVIQMVYANYQGKATCVAKFRNSTIMLLREAWRPKVFVSTGDSQGLPEAFPPPTRELRALHLPPYLSSPLPSPSLSPSPLLSPSSLPLPSPSPSLQYSFSDISQFSQGARSL